MHALSELRKGWALRGLPLLRIRIGIHSGPCLAGNVGSDSRLKVSAKSRLKARDGARPPLTPSQYTLMGDTVNLASRLEGLGKVYDVSNIISRATVDEPGVREGFCVRCLDLVAVVGRTRPVVIYTLLEKRSRASMEQLRQERVSDAWMHEYVAGRLERCMELLREMPLDKATMLVMKRVEQLLNGDRVNGSLVFQLDEK